jgi:hypothetical protein
LERVKDVGGLCTEVKQLLVVDAGEMTFEPERKLAFVLALEDLTNLGPTLRKTIPSSVLIFEPQ